MTMFGSQWLANPGSTYEIANSCRYNPGDNPKLSRTMTEGDRRQATFSWWIKRCGLGTLQSLFESGGAYEVVRFTTADQLLVRNNNSDVTTNRVFRDVNAWYHIVVTLDNDQSTASNRTRIFVNGVEETSFASAAYPASGDFTDLNDNGKLFQFGCANAHTTPTNEIDGYFAECNYLDGTAVTNTSLFAKTNDDGVHIPIATSLTYGTNGLQLLFGDSSALGDDTSGNGNDLTSSGLAAADQVTDSPTNNMPTLNTLSSGTGTLSDGNLQYVGVSSWTNSRLNLLVPDTGKWALRFKSTTSYQQIMVGLCAPDSATTYGDLDQNGVAMIRYNTIDGNFVTRVGGSRIADTGPPTVAAQTFFQLLFDMDNGKMGVAADDATSGTFADISTYPALDLNAAALQTARQPYVLVYSGTDSGAGAILDAGQSGWTTTVTGFKNLILANLDAPTITDGSAYFQATTYTGDGGSSHEINQTGNSTFEPTMVWIKSRSAATNHVIQDQIRGNFVFYPDLKNAEGATGGGWVKSFDSDGFTTDVNTPINDSGETFVGWQWKESSTPGFDIVLYTGSGSGANISHSLGVKPSVVLIKCRSDSTHWIINDWSGDYANKLKLNETEAASSSSGFVTAASSSTFTLGTDSDVNGSSRTYVAYCFAEVPGYSSISSYAGNGSSTAGPFIYTGFRPAWLMIKRSSGGTGNWDIFDNKRDPFNVVDAVLDADSSTVETTYSTIKFDFLSNGFKVRGTQSNINASGSTYIYMAFAENPFGGSGVAPVTAR